MERFLRRARAPLLILGLLAGCSKAQIYGMAPAGRPPPDNILSVSGSFCTEDPSKVEFPVKILFVVDVSQSMAVTDPPDPTANNFTDRTRAVIDVINTLAGQNGVQIGITTFQSSVNDHTNGFLPDVTAEDVVNLTTAAYSLGTQNGQTNYGGALDAAFQTLLADILKTDDATRERSKYVVIFVSDGLPNPPDSMGNGTQDILDKVTQIQDLEHDRRLGELKVHTVYLSGRTPPQFQAEPIGLLQEMARKGKGTFRNVGNGEKINFLDIDFTSFRRIFDLKSFTVINVNQRPLIDMAAATDSDGDSLSDQEEDLIGTDPRNPDTDGDGVSDFIEDRLRTAGFDPLDGADADCKVSPNDTYNRRDDDGDGLLNCEERYLGTNPRLYDTDADGLADPVEANMGTSPAGDDTGEDQDRDGVANGVEVRDHTDPTHDDQVTSAGIRYTYDLVRTGVKDSRVCYQFSVDNVQLMPTLGNQHGPKGQNEILLMFDEVPADAPHDFGTFRVACVHGYFDYDKNEKIPATGYFDLPSEAFKLTANPGKPDDPAFNPLTDCVEPQ